MADTHRTISRLNTLGKDFARERAGLLEYLATGELAQLADSRQARDLWDESFRALEVLVMDDLDEQKALENLGEQHREWVELGEKLSLPREEGHRTGMPTADEIQEELAAFKRVFLSVERMMDRANRQLVVRDESEKRAVSRTSTAIAFIMILQMLIFSFVLMNLYSSIARPISSLSLAVARYRNEDFSARVKVSNKSEIGFLEVSFNSMAEKIEQMVADLRKLDELKTEFLSTVSHELRTPLTSIGGYAKLIGAGDAGAVNEAQREFLSIIDTNVVRLTHLINDLLDVEKMESGRVQLDRSPQDLVSILRECKDTFEILARQKGLKLHFTVDVEQATVLGDRDRLIQIFMNLLSNAIKYTPSGSVELQLVKHDYAVTVKIRDTGVGLTPEEKERLFQKFYRARSGIATGEGGTGLGLVIVRGLVEGHGGTILVESEPGKGTTFNISLPLAKEFSAADSIIIGDIHEVEQAWARDVWIVDAHAEDARTMADLVVTGVGRSRGYQLLPRVFKDVTELPETKEDQPALIVLDLGPVGGEAEAFRVIRSRAHSTVPILVVGEHAADAAEALRLGAKAWLRKPLASAEFCASVSTLAALRGWRILLADPNTDLRILIKRSFEQRGLEVDDVDRGATVLTRLESGSFDVLLLDQTMGDLRPLELVRSIRKNPRYARLPIFVMSADEKAFPDPAVLESLQVGPVIAKYRGLGHVVDSICQFLEDKKLSEQQQPAPAAGVGVPPDPAGRG